MKEKKMAVMNNKDEFSEINNPYRPFDLASGDWFHHESVIDKIRKRFDTQSENRIIVLQGNPGSGKSSLLKRIASPPSLLGKNYIPIYLDSSNYIGQDANQLLYSVSKNVIDKLTRMGYDIPMPDHIKRRRIRTNTFESLLLLFDSYINREEILILIFDEFDKLLENIDTDVIADYILLSKYIEKSWNNYGLILAGDKRLVNLTRSRVINDFLENSFNIDIEEVLEEGIIKNLITAQVGEQLQYDDDAINKIIWYSGKNLYFQQLICHKIVESLNKEKKNRCLVDDVEKTIQMILKETPKEFGHAWERKLSIEDRIVVSALADKRITEKKEKGYQLKENKLLDNILENRLSEEIEKLGEFGYLSEMRRGHFAECPFKIPLYGLWIRKEHPFIKTVIENVDQIVKRIDIRELLKEIEKVPEDQLIPFQKNTIMDIGEKWCQLADHITNKKKPPDQLEIRSFFESFSKALKLSASAKAVPKANCFVIEIKNLAVGILEEAFCVIQDTPELTRDEILDLENKVAEFTQQAQNRLTLFFYFQESDLVKELEKRPYYLSLIPIDQENIKKIILADKPSKVFRKIILSRLSLSKISPYKTEGPAKTIFYGRSEDINRICSSTNKSFAIVGARKIGKTSLLHKIKDNPPPNTVYVFVSLEMEFAGEEKVKGKDTAKTESVKSYRTFFKSLEMAIERVLRKKVSMGSFLFGGREMSKLPKVIQKLSEESGKKIIFIIDEIDGLIKFDEKHDFKLMRLFRTLSQENCCQFIFAGFKELYHQKRDIDNPMYNFCKEIKLKPLDREAALDLITRPMESIGIQYKNEIDRDLILEFTGCHPNLLQFYCIELIEKIGNHEIEDRRTIFQEDIQQIFDSTYEEYIMDDVYMFKSDLNHINRLILILLTEEQIKANKSENGITTGNGNEKKFSVDEIIEYLAREGIKTNIDDIHRNLKNLVMRFILLEKGNDRYCFALSVFPEILSKTIDSAFKRRIIKEIKENEAKSV
jgi:Cdc6-like AAA superfamily ATPase